MMEPAVIERGRPARTRLANRVHNGFLAHAVIVVAALGLRIVALHAMPMHHDESIHASFAWSFPDYQYDPTYHGPLQIALMSLSLRLLGPVDAAARLPAAVAGTVLVALPYLVRHRIGRLGALGAAVLLAISPSFLYYSRFAREDIFAALLTLALVIAAFRWLDRPTRGRLALVFMLLALAVATKETSYITMLIAGAFFVGVGTRELMRRRHGGGPGRLSSALASTHRRGWLTAIASFLVVYTVLFTTFLSNIGGITGIIDGIAYWARQQAVTPLAPYVPPYFYLILLVAYELPAVVLGAVGLVVAIRRRRLFDLYLVWWFLASLVIFSASSERVPWLLLHILVPLTLLAALGASALWRGRRSARASVVAIVVLAVALFVRSTPFLYGNPSDPRELLVYVQTAPDMKSAADRVQNLAEEASASGRRLTVLLDRYRGADWPLSWYLVDVDLTLESVDMTNARFRPSADVILLTDGNRQRLAPGLIGYTSECLSLREWWVPGGRSPAWLPDYLAGSPGQWAGWLIDRRVWSPIGSEVVWLYVREG